MCMRVSVHNMQAYRHLLFNRMAYCEHGLRFRDLQLALFVIITEAYSKTQSQPHAKKGYSSVAFCGLMFICLRAAAAIHAESVLCPAYKHARACCTHARSRTHWCVCCVSLHHQMGRPGAAIGMARLHANIRRVEGVRLFDAPLRRCLSQSATRCQCATRAQ
jgi:hypothetical protein